MLYVFIILIAMLLIISGNLLFMGSFLASNLVSVSLSVVLGTASIIVLDAIGALVVRRLLPSSWFSPSRKLFRVSKKERDFYKRLGIKSWKDKIPELGALTGFRKNKLENTNDKAYLERFITEINYGTVVHIENAVLGFLILFIPVWRCNAPSVWIPIFSVNLVLNLLPMMILRYVGYTLQGLHKKASAKSKIEEPSVKVNT